MLLPVTIRLNNGFTVACSMQSTSRGIGFPEDEMRPRSEDHLPKSPDGRCAFCEVFDHEKCDGQDKCFCTTCRFSAEEQDPSRPARTTPFNVDDLTSADRAALGSAVDVLKGIRSYNKNAARAYDHLSAFLRLQKV